MFTRAFRPVLRANREAGGSMPVAFLFPLPFAGREGSGVGVWITACPAKAGGIEPALIFANVRRASSPHSRPLSVEGRVK